MLRSSMLATLALALPPCAASADADAAARALMTGEAWAEFCDRMKAVGQSILGHEFPRFTLRIGPDVEAGAGIRSGPDTDHLSIRQFYTDWAAQTPGECHLRRLTPGPTYPAPLGPAEMAARLDAAARWVETSIPMWNAYMQRSAAATPANTLSPPRAVAGASADIAYGGGWFELDDDQVLIIETTPPRARCWSIQYYSFGWFESPEFAQRQTSLNGAQARVDGDGKVRVVVSSRDPGVPNWPDTEGRRTGSLAYRWIWTEDRPTPSARVVPLAALREHLPADTPRFGPEQRREQVCVRREHVERRFRR